SFLSTQCLDENKKLILAILDNQNLGKLAECAQKRANSFPRAITMMKIRLRHSGANDTLHGILKYQAQLQKNLMYLAAIADAQPQMSAMPAQMAAPHPGMQQGAYYMHPQAAAMAQQNQGVFPPKMPMQFASPQQLQEQQHQHLQQQQHRQAMQQGQMNVLLGGGQGNNPMHSEAAAQNKQDGASTAGGHGSAGNPSN
ncbi:hypothetical protein V2J09_004261, partial [Rumex salicifolius]